ncbi:MAG: peptide chain release factor N(5)-glutamine methyltransferase [Candidatus Omnitrophica bacterium]|nr:peptide chain release factor N(5)-glutamine methyltransferase [Candidatus Omnitrophota bacterium]
MAQRGTVHHVIREGARRLQAAGMAHARHEAAWLLSRLMDSTPLEVYLRESAIAPHTTERFFSQIEARASGAPLQYLLGEAEFFGARFTVAPGTFIPRPETETVLEAAIQALRPLAARLGRPLRVVDLGAGSGCIALTLARVFPTCAAVGIELSWNALCVAVHNAMRHGLASRVRWIQGRWTEPLAGSVDGIVSNPPYIPSARVDQLPLDVQQEPRISLDGGPDGMRALLEILAQAPRALRPGGILAMECGEEQVNDLLRLAATASWVAQAQPLHDLAGRPRGILMARVAQA